MWVGNKDSFYIIQFLPLIITKKKLLFLKGSSQTKALEFRVNEGEDWQGWGPGRLEEEKLSLRVPCQDPKLPVQTLTSLSPTRQCTSMSTINNSEASNFRVFVSLAIYDQWQSTTDYSHNFLIFTPFVIPTMSLLRFLSPGQSQ